MGDDPEVRAIICALAEYVTRNPLASDTPEGIYRWWLGPEMYPMDKLVQALTWMRQKGLMEEQHSLDGRRRYRRSASDAELRQALADCENVRTQHH